MVGEQGSREYLVDPGGLDKRNTSHTRRGLPGLSHPRRPPKTDRRFNKAKKNHVHRWGWIHLVSRKTDERRGVSEKLKNGRAWSSTIRVTGEEFAGAIGRIL